MSECFTLTENNHVQVIQFQPCNNKLFNHIKKKTHMAPPLLSNFAYNSTHFTHCCSLAAIFRFPTNHKPCVCSIKWHNKHPLCITHIIIDEWYTLTAFFHFTLLSSLNGSPCMIRSIIKSTIHVDKKQQFKWPHIKHNKIHLTTFCVAFSSDLSCDLEQKIGQSDMIFPQYGCFLHRAKKS